MRDWRVWILVWLVLVWAAPLRRCEARASHSVHPTLVSPQLPADTNCVFIDASLETVVSVNNTCAYA